MDCRDFLKSLPEKSVHTCITSPPYFGLRDYGNDAQIGLEETPEQFVEALVEVFRGVKRVLADDGTVWLNLGDSYAGHNKMLGLLKPKDLIGVPWLVAFALQRDGWYLRQDIIWHKPNPMPESVTDRCTKSHEYIFLLSKSQKYFFDSEAIKEPLKENTLQRYKSGWNGNTERGYVGGKQNNFNKYCGKTEEEIEDIKLVGRNKRSVWSVTTKSFKDAHFATYPPDLIIPCILAGTSEKGHCPECGKRWVRVVDRQKGTSIDCPKTQDSYKARGGVGVQYGTVGQNGSKRIDATTKTIGWQPQCECGIEPVKDIVLDPFMGAATTALVSLQLNRDFIGSELNPEYIKIAQKRINPLLQSPKMF